MVMSLRRRIVKMIDQTVYRERATALGYPPILHLHIRKTAGTSFNMGMLSLLVNDPRKIYETTAGKLLKCSKTNLGRYCAWDYALAEGANYVFCHTHAPAWRFSVPREAFVVTILRDPMDRLLSLHRMLTEMFDLRSNHPGLAAERATYRRDFVDFLQALPDRELMAQLYHFSRDFDIDQAIRLLRRSVTLVGTTEGYDRFVARFNKHTGYEIPLLHLRQGRASAHDFLGLPASIESKLRREAMFLEQAVGVPV